MRMTGRWQFVDSILVAGLAFGVYALLGQETMYGVDAWNDLRRLAEGDSTSTTHILYRPMAAFAAGIGANWADLSLHDSVRMLSALLGAVGVGLSHSASRRLGLGRSAGFAVATLVGFTPCVAFYATVVERHAPFFGFAGFAFWCSARMIVSPRVGWALAFAVSVALAYAAHSTGVLLVALLLPFAAAELRSRSGPWFKVCAVAAVASGVCVWGAGRIAVAFGQIEAASDNFAILGEWAGVALEHPAQLVSCAWQEYLYPLMPISLCWVLGIARKPWHVIALACGSLVYLGFTFLILGGFQAVEGFGERGAYMLPLAWPLAHVTTWWLGRRAVSLAVVVAIALSFMEIRMHDVRPHDAVAIAARGLDAEQPRPYLLVADRADFEMLFTRFADYVHREDYLDLFRGAHIEDLAGGLQVAGFVPQLVKLKAAGRAVLISDAAVRFLEEVPRVQHPEVAHATLEALRAAFDFADCGIDGYQRLLAR